MNKTPLNYLITFAIGGLIWVVTCLVLANYLSENVFLASMEIEEFLIWYRLTITLSGVLSLLIIYYWFFYGNKDSTATDLGRAKKVWNISFITEIIIAVVILLLEVILFLDEGIEFIDYLIIFIAISAHTFFFYWLCTFFMSPQNVKFLVLFKK